MRAVGSRRLFATALAVLAAVACRAPQGRAQVPRTTAAGAVEQVFAHTSTEPAVFGPLERTFVIPLDVDLRHDSLLLISFDARAVFGPTIASIPQLLVRCRIDRMPCQPDRDPVPFLYPQFCCDTRSFSWVVHDAPRGPHTVRILADVATTEDVQIVLTQRTLAVQAARLEAGRD